MAAESHVDQGLLIVEASEVVHLLALELVLDPLAVRSVANERQDRSDAVDEEGALGGLGVVQGRLR